MNASMPSLESRVKKVFCEALRVSEDVVHDELAAGDIAQWDSLGHINVLQAVERELGIAFDVGDAISIETFGDLVAMATKYTAISGAPG